MSPAITILPLRATNSIDVLVRLTLDGQPDPTFTPVRGASLVLPAEDGKMWTYRSYDLPPEEGLLSRLNPDGTTDASWPVASIRGTRDVVGADARLMVLPDGNLLVVGIPWGDINGQPRRSLARLMQCAFTG